ncbi:MAG: hypothetical protein Q4A31_00710 [Corynebacterium sp.]|uniref:hypothetical protein n=1 Tax=Corynebacterium sp. TaxID=1720 RepID=UPI0026DB3491|nr:hypothetical protein [Corynebacterium sp.]MDO4760429.1 hypothetical protein [Corynebacterium sp.]
MSAFDPCREAVKEFIADLHTFATGAYLRESERAFWDAPFDEHALPELESLLLGQIDTIESFSSYADSEAVIANTRGFYDQLAAFNEKYACAVIEPEEEADIHTLLCSWWQIRGVETEIIATLPTLHDTAENKP